MDNLAELVARLNLKHDRLINCPLESSDQIKPNSQCCPTSPIDYLRWLEQSPVNKKQSIQKERAISPSPLATDSIQHKLHEISDLIERVKKVEAIKNNDHDELAQQTTGDQDFESKQTSLLDSIYSTVNYFLPDGQTKPPETTAPPARLLQEESLKILEILPAKVERRGVQTDNIREEESEPAAHVLLCKAIQTEPLIDDSNLIKSQSKTDAPREANSEKVLTLVKSSPQAAKNSEKSGYEPPTTDLVAEPIKVYQKIEDLVPAPQVQLGEGSRAQLTNLIPRKGAKSAIVPGDEIVTSVRESVQTVRLGLGAGSRTYLRHLLHIMKTAPSELAQIMPLPAVCNLILKASTFYVRQPDLGQQALGVALDLLKFESDREKLMKDLNKMSAMERTEMLSNIAAIFAVHSRGVEDMGTKILFMILTSQRLPLNEDLSLVLADPRKIRTDWTETERLLCLYVVAASSAPFAKEKVLAEILRDIVNPEEWRLTADLWIVFRLLEYKAVANFGLDDLKGLPMRWPRKWDRNSYWVRDDLIVNEDLNELTEALLQLVDSESGLTEASSTPTLDEYLKYFEPLSKAGLWILSTQLIARLCEESGYKLKMIMILQTLAGKELSRILGSISEEEWHYTMEFLVVVGSAHKSPALLEFVRRRIRTTAVGADDRQIMAVCEICSINAELLEEEDFDYVRKLVYRISEFDINMMRRWLMVLCGFLEVQKFGGAFDRKYVRLVLDYCEELGAAEKRSLYPKIVVERILVWSLKLQKLTEEIVVPSKSVRHYITISERREDWSEELKVLGLEDILM